MIYYRLTTPSYYVLDKDLLSWPKEVLSYVVKIQVISIDPDKEGYTYRQSDYGDYYYK